MKNILIFLVLITSIQCTNGQKSQKYDGIEEIYTKMELQGVDTDKPLLFGYFFFDKDKSKLAKLKDHLISNQYKLGRMDIAEEGKPEYILHVEKLESLTREGLRKRENELKELAAKFDIESYDGWDVGNPDPSKALVSNDLFEQSLRGKSPQEIFELGNKLYEEEIFDKSAIVFSKTVNMNYKLDTSYYKQGISLMEINLKNEGLALLEKCLEINPHYYKALFNLGVYYYDIGNNQKSIFYYQKTSILKPKDDRVYYGLAAAQFSLGKMNEAEVNCIKSLELNPNNENAKNLLNMISKKR